MRIIDTHNHLWNYSRERFSWITDELAAIRKDFFINDLLATLADNQISESILVQAVPELSETQWLLDISAAAPEVRGVIGWVEVPKGNGVLGELKKLQEHAGTLKGIRYMSQGLPASHLVEKNFIEGVQCIGAQGLVYELLITAVQLEAAEKLIAQCPDVCFVIEHIAKPAIRQGEITKWASDLRTIADRYPNVYCKLSGMATEANYTKWRSVDDAWSEIEPYMRVVFKTFGDHRVMFGSDWPVSLLALPYADTLQLCRRFLKNNPQYSADNFFHKVAEKVYNV